MRAYGAVVLGLVIGVGCLRADGTVVSTSVGLYHSMFVTADGTLVGMGLNSSGQLGDPTIVFLTSRPMKLASNVASVAAGSYHTLFIKTDGSLWATGDNGAGQLGDGTQITRRMPIQVAAGVKQVSTLSGDVTSRNAPPHTMFVKTDGTLWGMGANNAGQLGDGTKVNRLTPVQVAEGVSSVAVGGGFTLFLKTDGTLWMMGYDSGVTGKSHPLPVEVAAAVESVSANVKLALFVKKDHTLWQFGDVYSSGPSFVAATQVATDVRSASAGGHHLLLVKTDGTLWGGGSAALGALGDAPEPPMGVSFRQIATSVVSASAGTDVTLFIKTDGTLWGTGFNQAGQLGDGTTTDRHTPVATPLTFGLPSVAFPPGNQAVHPRGVATFTVIANGAPAPSFQWRKDGVAITGATRDSYTIVDAGLDDAGNYSVVVSNGLGTVASDGAELTIATPVQRVKSVATSDEHTLFVRADGSLWATGANDGGQLGDGTTVDRLLAVPVATNVTSVATGYLLTVFVKTDGTLWAMGDNRSGQLGDGTREQRNTPVQVAMGVSSVAAGGAHSVFVKRDGSLWEMGWDGYTGSSGVTPPQQRVAMGVASVAAGSDHTLFIKTDGTLWGMGSNDYGQLGRSELGFFGPILIASGVASVAAGNKFTVFVKTDGTLWGMGTNLSAELGLDRMIGAQRSPAQIATGVRFVATSGSLTGSRTLFVKSDGALWGMGSNRFGELGESVPPWSDVFAPAYLGYDGIVSLALGANHTLFVRADGTLWGMGLSHRGQLGTGFPPSISSAQSKPLPVTQGFGIPFVSEHPASAVANGHGAVVLHAAVQASGALTFQWQFNGASISGATDATLTLSSPSSTNAGLYTVVAENTLGEVVSDAAIVGLATDAKVIGSGTELQPANIPHPNGNVFDQVLLTGAAETITADFAQNQVTRTSFVDLDDDIVQVEFSGPGTLSLVLQDSSGPALPVNYNQDVNYMKGHAGIVITGADEHSNVSVFSVGRATAVNQALFKDGVNYDGIADIAFIAITSTNGKFGGVRTANANYFASRGVTGIYAPGVQFVGPVYVGNVTAFDAATPMLILGDATADTLINGGDLHQANGKAVQVKGLAQLKFVAGSTSHNGALPVQRNQARLEQDGVDVTAQIVVNPGP